jgi:hypothetical protein
VTHHVDISWNQAWNGTDLIRFYKLEGNTLMITLARTVHQRMMAGSRGAAAVVDVDGSARLVIPRFLHHNSR